MLQKGPLTDDDALRKEIVTLRAHFAKMSEVGRRITEILDRDVVLQEIVDGARSLTDAKYGAVGVFDNSGRFRQFITSGVTPEERSLLGDPPQGLGLLGYLNEIQEPLRLADLTRRHPLNPACGVRFRFTWSALASRALSVGSNEL